jgi:hypothetical protein
MKYVLFFIALFISSIFGYFVYPEDPVAGTTLGMATVILMEVIDLNLKSQRK